MPRHDHPRSFRPRYITGHNLKTNKARKFISELNTGNIYSAGIRRSEVQKQKLRLANIGKHHTEITKQKIRQGNIGKKRSAEERKRMSARMIGNSYTKGKKHTSKTRLKMRIAMIHHRQRAGAFKRNIGKHETQILDNLEIEDNIKIERGFEILGYFVDGYCKKTNTVYEVDEKYHNETRRKERDIYRQNEIENHLKCRFVRIPDNK